MEALTSSTSIARAFVSSSYSLIIHRSARATMRGFDLKSRFAVNDWLTHHGDALTRRFDPVSYAVLLDAMDSHDVGAGRGGVAQALSRLRVPLLAVSIESDQLYPADEVDRKSVV